MPRDNKFFEEAIASSTPVTDMVYSLELNEELLLIKKEDSIIYLAYYGDAGDAVFTNFVGNFWFKIDEPDRIEKLLDSVEDIENFLFLVQRKNFSISKVEALTKLYSLAYIAKKFN